MDASKRDSGKWTDTWSPLDLSQTLLVGGGLLVPYSLPGSPVIKQLMRMVTKGLTRVGGFSQCASPNKTTNFFLFLASPCPRSKERQLRRCRRAERTYSTLKVRRGGHEEIPLVQGKEQRLHFAGAAVKRYPTSKVRETRVRRQVLREGIRGQKH